MAYQSCSSCGGSGSVIGAQNVYDPSGGYMWKTVQTRTTCSACGGSGGRYVADPTPVYRPPKAKPSAKRAAGSKGSTTAGADETSVDPGPPKKPMFAFVDRYFERHFSGKRAVVAGLVCGFLAAMGTYGYAQDRGMSDDGAMWLSIGAGVVGLAIIPLLNIAIKLTLFAAVLCVVGMIGYGIYSAATTDKTPPADATGDTTVTAGDSYFPDASDERGK